MNKSLGHSFFYDIIGQKKKAGCQNLSYNLLNRILFVFKETLGTFVSGEYFMWHL